MDPLSIQGAATTGWARPQGSSTADLSAVLRQGRVFAGDVLQTFGGGSLLIGVGGLRVPAKSQAELQPGRRYLFEVLSSGETLELKLLPTPHPPPGELARALRQALGSEAPLGALLEELSQALASALEGAPAHSEEKARPKSAADSRAARWLAALEAHSFSTADGPAALREQLLRSGLGFEARLADLALESAPSHDAARIGDELVRALLEHAARQANSDGPSFDAPGLLRRLGEALRVALAAAGPGATSTGSGSASHLARSMSAALSQLAPADARAFGAALAALDWEHWPRWMRTLAVRTLAGRDLLRPSAAATEAALAALTGDLKAQLLAADGQLHEGSLRAALERALGGLEADQLLNLARTAVDESPQWSVALREGAQWSTLHLRVVRDGGRSAFPADGERSRRVALEVDFSRTGPVHVDLLLAERSVTARVLTRSDELARFLSMRAPELEQALAAGGAAVLARVVRAANDGALHGDAPSQSSYFASHGLMDVEG
jgi:hypothetical protein